MCHYCVTTSSTQGAGHFVMLVSHLASVNIARGLAHPLGLHHTTTFGKHSGIISTTPVQPHVQKAQRIAAYRTDTS